MSHLFALPSDSIAVTSDDCYTPRWVFDAMGLHFDLDVAAPPGGPWHVPADRYFTAEDDGLAQPWDGLVWCNPPYSGLVASRQHWRQDVYSAAEAIYIGKVDFWKSDGSKLNWFGYSAIFTAFRGVGTEPAERLAAADPYGAVLYGKAAS